MEGDVFWVQQSSAVPTEQALQQSYNKTAEDKVNVIRIITWKATMPNGTLIKHEKNAIHKDSMLFLWTVDR